jgi:hypothetical protein
MYATMEFEMSYTYLGYRAHKAQFGRVNEFLENAKENHIEIYRNATNAVYNCRKIYIPSQSHAKNIKENIFPIDDD